MWSLDYINSLHAARLYTHFQKDRNEIYREEKYGGKLKQWIKKVRLYALFHIYESLNFVY